MLEIPVMPDSATKENSQRDDNFAKANPKSTAEFEAKFKELKGILKIGGEEEGSSLMSAVVPFSTPEKKKMGAEEAKRALQPKFDALPTRVEKEDVNARIKELQRLSTQRDPSDSNSGATSAYNTAGLARDLLMGGRTRRTRRRRRGSRRA
jgi:hypothetical protein